MSFVGITAVGFARACYLHRLLAAVRVYSIGDPEIRPLRSRPLPVHMLYILIVLSSLVITGLNVITEKWIPVWQC